MSVVIPSPRGMYASNVARRYGPYVVPPSLAYGAYRIATRGYRFARGAYNMYRRYAKRPAVKAASKPVYKARAKRRPAAPLKTLKAKVNNLVKTAEQDMGHYTKRIRNTGRVVGNANASGINSFVGFNGAVIEATIDGLKVFDPATPATLITTDFTAGTFMKDIYIKSAYVSMKCRNNYQVPIKIRLYLCTPKADTDISPTTAMTNGLTDVGAPSSTSTLVYPTDSPQFRDLWSIKASYSFTLMPGREKKHSASIKGFYYDPSLTDSHPQTYQARHRAHVWMVRVEGIFGHDTTANEQGTLQSNVDLQYDTVVNVKYAAGADIRYIEVEDNSDTFTNGGVVSSMPVADNIGYSVA